MNFHKEMKVADFWVLGSVLSEQNFDFESGNPFSVLNSLQPVIVDRCCWRLTHLCRDLTSYITKFNIIQVGIWKYSYLMFESAWILYLLSWNTKWARKEMEQFCRVLHLRRGDQTFSEFINHGERISTVVPATAKEFPSSLLIIICCE